MSLVDVEIAVKRFFLEVDAYGRMTLSALGKTFRRPLNLRETVYHFDRIGVESLFIILLTGLFTGMVLALQGVTLFGRFGATNLVGSVIGATIVRELGPVLAALLVAGRCGSAITAELGSMRVTEQIDAYVVEGTDVFKKLLVPRFLACMFSLPLLTVVADAVGMAGGFFIVATGTDLNANYYWHSIVDFLELQDLAIGLFKPLFFGLIIASIACHVGMETRGGAEDVGISAKRAVVLASVFILISDFFLTKLFLVIFP